MVSRNFCPVPLDRIVFILIILLILKPFTISGQLPAYNYFYRIYFRDKGTNTLNDFSLAGLISSKSIERREKAGISSPVYTDIPVYSGYLEQISPLGFRLHCKSRWMNTAVFKTVAPGDLISLLNLPFVSSVKLVKHPSGKYSGNDKLYFRTYADDMLQYNRPLSMLNGVLVQNSGFNGKGVLIAVLDNGFLNADIISSLNGLRKRNGIKGTYDFVKNNTFVYDFDNHGTAILSILSGEIPNLIAGTAPAADYWLFRTEDTETEYPVEEDYWIAGAEFADSIGADIITSSLGYYSFDDPLLNYKYSDLDGNTAYITKAADIAASKGIVVACSAGNERTNSWLHIIAPSDGDSVLAVGAVDGNNMISSFSSAGPSFDNRIKPDVVAQGVSVPVQVQTSFTNRSNGTSFSCPVISGMCACVMQAVPKATSYDIINSIRQVSDRFNSPDSLYGYGIPDMVALIVQLQNRLVKTPEDKFIVNPNPFSTDFSVTFMEPPDEVNLEIFSADGRLILKKNYPEYAGRSMLINGLENINDGLYFIRLSTPAGSFTQKLIKISR